MEQVLRLEPGRRDVRRKLVDLAMTEGVRRFDDAERHLKVLLGRARPVGGASKPASAEDAELESLLGDCTENRREFREAADWYAEAVAHSPSNLDGSMKLASLLRNQLNDPGRADKVIDEMIAANERTPSAYLGRRLYRLAYKIDGPDRDLARAMELAPDEPEILLTASGDAIARGDFAGAKSFVTRGLERSPGDWRLYEMLADIEKKTAHPAEARAALTQGLERIKESAARLQLSWDLSQMMLDDGLVDEAAPMIERLQEDKVRSELIQFLKARVLFDRQQWAEAAAELEGVRNLLTNRPDLAYQTNVLLATCFEKLLDDEGRLASLRRAVELNPESPGIRQAQVMALTNVGKFDEAIAIARTLPEQDPSARVGLIRLLVTKVALQPKDRRDWSEIDRLLPGVASSGLDPVAEDLLRADVLFAKGEVRSAREVLIKSRDRDRTRIEPWLALATLEERRDKPGDSSMILDEAERALGDRAAIRIARARSLGISGASDAPKVAHLLDGIDRFSPEERRRLLRAVAETYRSMGDEAAVARTIGRLVEDRPADLSARIEQFDSALRTADDSTMQLALDAIKSIEGDQGAHWALGMARRLIKLAAPRSGAAADGVRLTEARRIVNGILVRRPTWSMALVAKAEIDDLSGDRGQAVEGYLRAIDQGEFRLEIYRRATELLNDRRRFAESDTLARKFEERRGGLTDRAMLKSAARAALETKDTERGANLARKAILAESRDPRELLWLGVAMASAGKDAEAGRALRRATELSGQDPEPWLALVRFLVRSGRKPEAEATIEQARAKLTGETMHRALAGCYEMVDQNARARSEYQETLKAMPNDPVALQGAARLALRTNDTGEARPLLDRLIALSEKAPESSDWARRILSLMLADRGSFQDAREALRLAGFASGDDGTGYQPSASESLGDLRTKARVLALGRSHDQRKSAIRLFESIDDRQPLQAEDRFLLARLYDAEKNWTKTRDQMSRLMADGGEDPAHLAFFARCLLEQDDEASARSWIGKLKRKAPDDPATAELEARSLHAQKKDGEATKVLRAFAGRNSAQLARVAAIFDSLGLIAEAEEFYRKNVDRSKRPESSLTLVFFLANHGRLDEAFDVAERLWTTCPAEQVAGVLSTSVYLAAADDRQYRRAFEAIERAPGLTPAFRSLQLANVRNRQDRRSEALELYRKALEQDRSNIDILNNMAWLLAMTGEAEQSLQLIGRAMEIAGPLPSFLDTRALAYLGSGKVDRAIKDLEDAVAFNPSALKYLHLARAYAKANRPDDAAKAIKSAESLGLNPKTLHPLDAEGYRGLLETLAKR